jgi:hypothetical protein
VLDQIVPPRRDPTNPGIVLRLEGIAMFVVMLLLYRELGLSWWLFVLLFLLPDLSFLAYLADTKVGAVVYNAAHTYVFPALLFVLGFVGEGSVLMGLGLIWGAHIAFDRFFGFGLKYPTDFKDTHLQRLVRVD